MASRSQGRLALNNSIHPTFNLSRIKTIPSLKSTAGNNPFRDSSVVQNPGLADRDGMGQLQASPVCW